MSNKIDKIIVHHTGGTDANPKEDTSHHTAAIVKAWHIQKGWGDIGYNWFIEKDGKTVKGRSLTVAGAHTIGQNTTSIGICFAGNFDATYPTKEQEESFKKLYNELYQKYPHITPDKVYPHRKYAKKTCYGMLLKDDFAQKLAEKALVKQTEIKDGSAEALAYCKSENARMSSLIESIKSLFK